MEVYRQALDVVDYYPHITIESMEHLREKYLPVPSRSPHQPFPTTKAHHCGDHGGYHFLLSIFQGKYIS